MLVQTKLPELVVVEGPVGDVGTVISCVEGLTVVVVIAVGHWYCEARTHRFWSAENIVIDGHCVRTAS